MKREKDYTEAAYWYGLAAEGGDGPAANNLGQLYEQGFGVEKDPEKAAVWFFRSARTGYTEGIRNYIRILETGTGLPMDKEAAAYWRRQLDEQINGKG